MVRLSQDAWPCAALQDVFLPDFYQQLLSGLPSLKWVEASRRFYRQREVNLTGVPHYERLFDQSRRSRIASAIGAFFGVDVDIAFDIAAHKMIEGDYIGVHTDANEQGESHRLTVTMNDGWRVESGGVLLSLNDRSLRSVRDAWLPTANNGFLFEISDRSFHAVTPIVDSTPRYSLILTFKGQRSCVPKVGWVPFPLQADIDSAASTASYMGISGETFTHPYQVNAYKSVAALRAALGGELENAPVGWTYRDGRSMNVDWQGQQPRGSDAERLRQVRALRRIPPIIIVRRRTGTHCLVDGSHRLSYATDENLDVVAALFVEV